MSNPLKEQLLLFRVRTKRDPAAFGKLYDAYVQRMYRFIYFKVGSSEEAQDLTSETFLRLWQYLEAGKPVRHLGALLFEIARNLVSDHHRKTRPVASIDEAERALLLPDIEGLTKIRRSAELSQVLATVKLLKDEYREVLIMRYIDGMSTREVADAIGKSSGAVRVLLHRSLETVRALLAPVDRNQETGNRE